MDKGALFFGGDFVRMDERHRVDLDDVVDDKFHASKADALSGEMPPAPRFIGTRDVHVERNRRFGEM